MKGVLHVSRSHSRIARLFGHGLRDGIGGLGCTAVASLLQSAVQQLLPADELLPADQLLPANPLLPTGCDLMLSGVDLRHQQLLPGQQLLSNRPFR